ncbi:unnamed protein product [Lasius platythorax]|uniref:DDE Tnp4 domain-containing protein n=1 Tax=Lasius platythorax TaxID=488582 RepID=A0AAV2N056_9HYME
MNEDNLLDNAIDLLENSSTSSDDDNIDSNSTSSSDDSSSTTSSDDSNYNLLLENDIYEEDLLFPLLHFLNNGHRRRVEDFLHVARAKSNEEFREDFRLTRPIVYLLLEFLETSGFIPLHESGKKKKSAELCLLMTLWFLNNKEPHRTLSNLFDMSLSSVFRIIRRVINWLVTIVPEVITWPEGNNITKVSHKFQEIAGIRNCIGAIDGSHIYINKPEENGREYFNRKQCYSILLQAVTDSNMKFTNIYCGDPGSFHDVRMLRRSELFRVAELERENIFPNTFLLGDKGYNGVAKKWIVSPFKDNDNLTIEQVEFNRKVSATRVVVEKAFSILKGRFRQLQKLPLRDTHFMTRIIIACCVLHNICLNNDDNDKDFYIEEDIVEQNELRNCYEQRDENVYAENLDRRTLLFREMYPYNN